MILSNLWRLLFQSKTTPTGPSPPVKTAEPETDLIQFLNSLTRFSLQEIIAGTLIGEAESLGELGMTQVACVLQNRVAAKAYWGRTLRDVCLFPYALSCWLAGGDRDRILQVMDHNPLYAPYVKALAIANDLVRYGIVDVTKGAVSYYDVRGVKEVPPWAVGKTPCLVNGAVRFFDAEAVLGHPLPTA